MRRLAFFALSLFCLVCALGVIVGLIGGLSGCDSHKTTAVRIVPVPSTVRYYPVVRDPDRNAIGLDPEGAPSMTLWDSGVTNLVGVRMEITCPLALPPTVGKVQHHDVRFVYRGDWSLVVTDGDSLRGSLAWSECLDAGPGSPVPIPDSLGTVTGGSFALGARADTLEGTARVSYQGPCSCSDAQVFVVKEIQ